MFNKDEDWYFPSLIVSSLPHFPSLVGSSLPYFPSLVGSSLPYFPSLVGSSLAYFPSLVGSSLPYFPSLVGMLTLLYELRPVAFMRQCRVLRHCRMFSLRHRTDTTLTPHRDVTSTLINECMNSPE